MLCLFTNVAQKGVKGLSQTLRDASLEDSFGGSGRHYAMGAMAPIYDTHKGTEVDLQLLGPGCNAIAYAEGCGMSLAQKDGVTVFVAGAIPGAAEAKATPAEFLLSEYHAEDFEDNMERVAELKGAFAFVLYDTNTGHIIASRDSEGTQPLFWGQTLVATSFKEMGMGLMFATDPKLIEAQCDKVLEFPAHTLFVSNAWDTIGEVVTLSGGEEEEVDTAVKAEVSEPAKLCRPSSHADLQAVHGFARVPSQTDFISSM